MSVFNSFQTKFSIIIWRTFKIVLPFLSDGIRKKFRNFITQHVVFQFFPNTVYNVPADEYQVVVQSKSSSVEASRPFELWSAASVCHAAQKNCKTLLFYCDKKQATFAHRNRPKVYRTTQKPCLWIYEVILLDAKWILSQTVLDCRIPELAIHNKKGFVLNFVICPW